MKTPSQLNKEERDTAISYESSESHYLLLTPGPLTTSSQVRQAMMLDWCTWDEDYKALTEGIRTDLISLAKANPSLYTSVLMQGSGTFAVESVIGSVMPPEGKLLIGANGAYGERMVEIAATLRIDHIAMVESHVTTLSPARLDRYLMEHPDITHVAFVHGETTSGMLNPLEELCRVAKQHQCTLIVDAMSTFGGIPIDVEALDIDFVVSSSNKCLQGVPGFGYVIAKRSAIEQTNGWARSLSLNLYDQWNTMEKTQGKWRYTSPTHTVHALSTAMKELQEEGGIEARYQRYKNNHRVLVEGMKALGFMPVLPPELQGPIITNFHYPIGEAGTAFDFALFYEGMKKEGFVIYPGKLTDADTFRVGTIGHVFPDDMHRFIHAVKQVMKQQQGSECVLSD